MKPQYPGKKLQRRGSAQIRHTHKTAAGLEDALAVMLDVLQEIEILNLRVIKAQDILKAVRGGPHAYVPDRPAGERLVIRRIK